MASICVHITVLQTTGLVNSSEDFERRYFDLHAMVGDETTSAELLGQVCSQSPIVDALVRKWCPTATALERSDARHPGVRVEWTLHRAYSFTSAALVRIDGSVGIPARRAPSGKETPGQEEGFFAQGLCA